jgi:hypothetical protein
LFIKWSLVGCNVQVRMKIKSLTNLTPFRYQSGHYKACLTMSSPFRMQSLLQNRVHILCWWIHKLKERCGSRTKNPIMSCR